MQSDPIITVENLGKRYQLGVARQNERYTALRDVLAQKARNLWRPRRSAADADAAQTGEFWALKNVSFSVGRGEVVGIIGHNGAGKSTLLKILSRITEPTEGRVTLKGRVASLLEVGTGFHPELTGRENIFLNGVILGMTRAEVKSKFDEIVAFAEMERFLDTPVKRYSSGMYVRLAFAVAAHLEPEILIIDEVLAVGDARFQEKCLGKINDIAMSSRTVLLVSHSLGTLGKIASTGIWLRQGTLQDSGDVQGLIQRYLHSGARTDSSKLARLSRATGVLIQSLSLVQTGSSDPTQIKVDREFTLELVYTLEAGMSFCRVGLMLENSTGTTVFHTEEADDPHCSPINRKTGDYKSSCRVPAWLLMAGEYFVTVHVDDAPQHRLITVEQAYVFTVIENALRSPSHPSSRPGTIGPKLEWQMDFREHGR